MKTLVIADVQSLHFEVTKDGKRIDFVKFMADLKTGYDVKHAVAYGHPTTEAFDRLLASCGFEVITDKSTHTHQLCMDTIELAANFDRIILMSTRYYLHPLVTRLKRMGKDITIFGYKTPQHIQMLGEYGDIETFIEETNEAPKPT